MRGFLIATIVSIAYLIVAATTTYEVAILAAVTTLVIIEVNKWFEEDAE